jgi:protein-arginine kinase activator protein McsA
MITTRYCSSSDTTPKTDLDKLKLQLEVAIENEDFEKAVELRDKIKTLETSRKEIEVLELELKKSIEEQNFEKSIKLRDKIKSLKK